MIELLIRVVSSLERDFKGRRFHDTRDEGLRPAGAARVRTCTATIADPLLDDPAACRLDPPATDLHLDAPPLRALCRARRLSCSRRSGERSDEILQPGESIFTISLLAAVPLRLDDDDAVGADPLVGTGNKSRLHAF